MDKGLVPPMKLGKFGRSVAIAITSLVVAFVGWSVFAKMDSGAIAIGVVSPEGNLFTMQHLEGGIVKKVFVQDGDSVKKGDVIAELDNQQVRSAFVITENRVKVLEDLVQRLECERDGKQMPALTKGESTDQTEALVFMARREKKNQEIAILQRKQSQKYHEATGYSNESNSLKTQEKLLREREQMFDRLVGEKFVSKAALMDVQTRRSEKEGALARAASSAVQSQEAAKEVETEIAHLKAEWRLQVLEDLKKFRTDLVDAREQLTVAQSRLDRTRILATTDGKIQGLRILNEGEVVQAGGEITKIVPDKKDYVMEAKLSTDDIERIWVGQTCRVRLNTFNGEKRPLFPGEVLSISGDSIKDDRSGAAYYKVRVSLAQKPDTQLQPGMTGQVELSAGEKTVMRYLLDPLLDSFNRSFREY